MQTGKLNRLNHPGWIQRAAERREMRRRRRELSAKLAIPQADVGTPPAEPDYGSYLNLEKDWD